MEVITGPNLEAYAEAHSLNESPVLSALAQETREKLPETAGMLLGSLAGGFLRLMVRTSKARRVLDIGTYTGYSALALAEALPEDGEVITCDNDADVTEIARRHWEESPHGGKIQLRLGEALDTLKDLEGPFDLIFLDADKGNYINYWEAALPFVPSGGLLISDNTLMHGGVLDPQEDREKAIVRFNTHVANDSRVEAVLMPIRDGVTLAWKK